MRYCSVTSYVGGWFHLGDDFFSAGLACDAALVSYCEQAGLLVECGFSDTLRISVGKACPPMFDSPSLNIGAPHKKHVGLLRICGNEAVVEH